MWATGLRKLDALQVKLRESLKLSLGQASAWILVERLLFRSCKTRGLLEMKSLERISPKRKYDGAHNSLCSYE